MTGGAREIIEIGSKRYEIFRGTNADTVDLLDSDDEPFTVPSFEQWVDEADLGPEPDGGEEVWNGTCPMCGAGYQSYLDHINHCEADRQS